MENLNDMEELIHRFEQMLKNQKNDFFDSQEFVDIIWYYYYEGEMTLFSKALKMGLEQHPNCIEIHIAQAEYYIYNESYYKALAICEKLLDELSDTDERKEEVLYMMVDVYSNMKKYTKATALLMQIKAITKDLNSVLMSLGNIHLYQNDYRKALQYFKEVYESGEDDFFAFNDMITCYNELKLHNELKQYLYKEVEKNPYRLDLWEQIGLQCVKLKDYQEAIDAFETGIAIDDTQDFLFVERAEVFEKLEQYERAIESYKEIKHEEMLNDGSVDLAIANCYKKMKKYDLALPLYHSALKKDPSNEDYWLELIHAYYLANDFDSAQKYIQKALAIDEENPKFLRMGYLIYFSDNQFQKAEQLIEQAVKVAPEDFDSWLKWMDTNLVIQDYKKALDIAIEADEKFDENAEVSYRLAGFYLLNQQVEMGLLLLNQTHSQYPNQKDIFTFYFPMLAAEELIQKILNS